MWREGAPHPVGGGLRSWALQPTRLSLCQLRPEADRPRGVLGSRGEPGARTGSPVARARGPVEDDSHGEENDEQGHISKRKIVSNWDPYQDTEKEVDNESGGSPRETDFSVLSSAGVSPQFLFAEVQKERGGESSCPKQNSAFYVNSESLGQDLQELPLPPGL